ITAPGERPLDLVEQQVEHVVEQLGLVPVVVVQRHGLDAERAAEAAHGQRLETYAVDLLQRGTGDGLARQRRAAPGRTAGLISGTAGHGPVLYSVQLRVYIYLTL